jgi:uncharacterized protein YqgQ
MFSVIISTIHDIHALKPIFLSSSKSAELIIIDTKYSEEKKEELKKISHNFKKLTYAPPKKREKQMAYDFLSGNNTGLAYAEEPWCFAIGDNWELKLDFYDRLKETIELFSSLYENHFVVRPIELEPHNNDVRWVSYVKFKQRYFYLPCAPLGSTGLRQYLPIITCGAIIANQETWYKINGFNEQYDVGAGWYDNELFDKFVWLQYPIILDQQLMTFRCEHTSSFSREGRDECKNIYDNGLLEHKIYAPNDFDLKELHDKMMIEKEAYVI